MPVANVLQPFSESIFQLASPISEAMKDAREAVEFIDASKELFRVDDVANHLGVNVRQIQRIFSMYVGMPPKWVIDRYRMLEAVDEMNSERHVDIADLALKLGYSDQAHFSNQFKAMTGFSPSTYQKKRPLGSSPSSGGR